jgi:YihY family inner membrane protein
MVTAAETSDDEQPNASPLEPGIRRIDAFQQRTFPLNFVFGVMKKFGDDSAGSQAALIAYYGFLSIFPLLLVLITLLSMFVSPGTEHRIVHSALSQFPIVGNQLSGPNGIHKLKSGSTVGLVVGLVGLVWGALGITQAAQRAMAEVWNVPGVVRPGFFPRLGRSGAFLVVLFFDVLVTTVLAGITTFGGHSLGVKVGAIVISVVVDVGIFILAFRVLTPKTIETKCLVLGAILAGIAWAILQYVGTALVAHQLRHSSQIYGYFASILGLIAFLFLAAEITLYAAEFNVVQVRHLWPRSIEQPPLTDADLRVLTDIALVGERRPEQDVEVHYHSVDQADPEPKEPPMDVKSDPSPTGD